MVIQVFQERHDIFSAAPQDLFGPGNVDCSIMSLAIGDNPFQAFPEDFFVEIEGLVDLHKLLLALEVMDVLLDLFRGKPEGFSQLLRALRRKPII